MQHDILFKGDLTTCFFSAGGVFVRAVVDIIMWMTSGNIIVKMSH